jgi:hypothetical protein
MSRRLDSARLGPGIWFVRAGRLSRGYYPVTPEGWRLVRRYLLAIAAVVALGFILMAKTGQPWFLAIPLVAIALLAAWFAGTAKRHADLSIQYRDLKVKSDF